MGIKRFKVNISSSEFQYKYTQVPLLFKASRERAVQMRWQKAGIEANSGQATKLSECEQFEKVFAGKNVN